MNYFTIDKFLGLNLSQDLTGITPGQLTTNNNYLYMANGGLQERGGGDELTTDPTAANTKIYGFDNYLSNTDVEYLIAVQGTKYYGYYSSAWNDLGVTVTTNLKTRMAQAGFGSNRALYGVNGTNLVVKVSGAPPTAATVASSPTTGTGIILHKNRLFTWDKDTLYFTEALGFDTWNTSANTINIAPGIDGYIQTCEIWGDSLFIFKEYGIYVIPNAADPDPVNTWSVLRSDAEIGTQSPDSVKKTRIGIVFLGSDNKVRLTGPTVTLSSGQYTLGGTGAPSICESIFDYINENISNVNVPNAAAIVFEDLYILSFQSVNNSSTFNDITFFADTTKNIKLPTSIRSEPFWGMFTGFNYDFFVTQTVSGKLLLYGAKGSTGHIQNILNNLVHNDNGSAINSNAVLGLYPIGSNGTYSRINHLKFVGYTENWNLNLVFNSYKMGDELPEDGVGIQKIFSSNSALGGIVDTGTVDTSIVGSTNTTSTIYHVGLRGNFFKAEFSNNSSDQFTRIVSMLVYYRPINQK